MRILYLPTKLSGELNDRDIKILRMKFKTNKFGTIDKLLKEIDKLYNLKKPLQTSLFYDKLRK